MRYNTSIKSREPADCTVRALAAAAGLTYREAYRIMAKAGRPKGRRSTWQPFLQDRVSGFDLRPVFNFRFSEGPPPTLNQFVKNYRTGVYLVGVKAHMLTVKNGIVWDSNKTGPRARIYFAWEPRTKETHE